MSSVQLKASIAAAAVMASALPTHSQPMSPATIDKMVLQYDFIPGMGLVLQIGRAAVNDHGDWIVEVTTDHPDPLRDSAVLLNGNVLIREGDEYTPIIAATFSDFVISTLTNDVQPGMQAFFDGQTVNSDSGILLGSSLVKREGTISFAPQFGPGTSYVGFHHTVFANPTLAVTLASMDDPTIPSRFRRALIRLILDSSGSVQFEEVVAMSGQSVPGGGAIAGFDMARHAFAADQSGGAIFVANLDESSVPDRVIMRDNDVLARTGESSPLPGKNWGSFRSASVDVNAQNDHVILGDLESGRQLLVRNGTILALQGEPVAAAGGAPLVSMPTHGPVFLNESGDVLWWGKWEDQGRDTDSGLMLNDQLLVQEGVTELLLQRVDDIMTGEGTFTMSDNGQFVAFKARLDLSGYTGFFRIQIEQTCYPDCDQSTGTGVLDIFDFLCFQDSFVSSQLYACDCDLSTGPGICDVFDFLCFQNAFVSGCP